MQLNPEQKTLLLKALRFALMLGAYLLLPLATFTSAQGNVPVKSADAKKTLARPLVSSVQDVSLKASSSSRRAALLIANQSYPWGPLETPINDLSALEQQLTRTGFTVQTVKDGSQQEMYSSVDTFIKDNAGADTLLFFFAGHAIQLNGRNYLVPINTKIDQPDLLSSLFDLRYLVDNFGSIGIATRLIIIDACRSNPFSTHPNASSGLSEVVAPPNTLIAFSTSPGSTAEDGDSDHSPYTAGLLKHLFRQGSKIEDSFKSVRRFVRLATDSRQTPWENTSLENDFVLASDSGHGALAGNLPKKQLANRGSKADLCQRIFSKYSLGVIELTPEELEAVPNCK